MKKFTKLLTAPGNGVFTVNTAKERKENLHQLMYGKKGDEVQDSWLKNLAKVSDSTKTIVLGVPSDCGGGILRGANWGPLFIREKLYEASSIEDYLDIGDIRVIPHLLHDKYLNEETLLHCREALYQDSKVQLPVSPLSITEMVMDEVHETNPQNFTLAFGGDHSVSYPLVKSYLRAKKKQNIKTALIHFDAHTDLLDKRLGIDLCFGSWTYHILDDLPSPELAIQLGIRSTGKDRNHWEKTMGVEQIWANEIQQRGPFAIAEQIIEKLQKNKVEEIYVSFDIDALDIQYASATGTPESSGLTPHDSIAIIKEIGSKFKISGADVMEVAPFINHFNENLSANEPEMTLQSATQIASVLSELAQSK